MEELELEEGKKSGNHLHEFLASRAQQVPRSMAFYSWIFIFFIYPRYLLFVKCIAWKYFYQTHVLSFLVTLLTVFYKTEVSDVNEF